jgi:hypothetical protein
LHFLKKITNDLAKTPYLIAIKLIQLKVAI